MINPAVRELMEHAARHAAFQEIIHRFSVETHPRAQLSGLVPAAKALYLTLLWHALERPVLVVTGSNSSAENLFDLIEAFFDILAPALGAPRPLFIPALDTLPGQDLSPHVELKEQRAVGLFRIASRAVSLVVTPLAGALLRNESASSYRQLALRLKQDEEIPMEDLAAHLESIGYERREPVEMEGEYSIRGGIFDIFPAQAHKPVRLEFFGDSIESLRRFDPETQRSVLKVDECTVLPLEETPRTPSFLRALAERAGKSDVVDGEHFPGWEFAVPLLKPREHSLENLLDHPVVIWDEPEALKSANDQLWNKLEPLRENAAAPPEQIFFHLGELMASAPERREIELRELGLEGELHSAEALLEIPSRPPVPFRNDMKKAVEDARQLAGQGYRVAFFAASAGEVERMADIFAEYSLPYQLGIDIQKGATPDYLADRAYLAMELASVYLVQGRVRRGAILPASRLAIIGHEDLFETSDLVAAPGRQRSHIAAFTPETLELKPGDYVVHAQHGVGKFIGLRQMTTGETTEDFMLVEYASESKLYVPLTRLDLIQKYRGAGEAPPALDKLGGVTWAKTKSSVKAKMRDMAEELLKLYAARKMAEGFGFSSDSNWQREFEDAFEYTATRDQFQAVAEIKRDMESSSPDGPPALRRRWLRQNRGGHARRLQSAGRRQAGGSPRPDDSARPAALGDLSKAISGIPRPHRDAEPVPLPQGDQGDSRRLEGGQGRHRHRHTPLALQGRRVPRPRPAHRRRGATLRRAAQRAAQADARRASTSSR